MVLDICYSRNIIYCFTQGEKPEELVQLEEVLGIEPSDSSTALWGPSTSHDDFQTKAQEKMSTPPQYTQDEEVEGASAGKYNT